MRVGFGKFMFLGDRNKDDFCGMVGEQWYVGKF